MPRAFAFSFIHRTNCALPPLTAAVGGDALRRVVAGRQHQPVEEFFHRERFALEKVHRRALAQVLAFDRDLLREFAVLQRD